MMPEGSEALHVAGAGNEHYDYQVLPVGDVVRILKGIPAGRFSPETVETLLQGVAVEPSSLAPYLHFVEGRYTRNLIHRDGAFELLALCWDTGTFSPIHNHSGQDCWFLVHQGQFCVKGFRLLQGGLSPGRAELEEVEVSHRNGMGALDHRGPERDIHRVVVSKGSTPAVSLHVYAKPFDDCLVYDLKKHLCHRQRLQYHSVDGKPFAA